LRTTEPTTPWSYGRPVAVCKPSSFRIAVIALSCIVGSSSWIRSSACCGVAGAQVPTAGRSIIIFVGVPVSHSTSMQIVPALVTASKCKSGQYADEGFVILPGGCLRLPDLLQVGNESADLLSVGFIFELPLARSKRSAFALELVSATPCRFPQDFPF